MMFCRRQHILKTNLDCLGMANSLMYWTFTDVFEEKGGGEEIFHGGFGMINFQGLVKPSFSCLSYVAPIRR
ncbi:MAG: GH39 family glycosyl hydrolase [Bacteroides cellulosilyticus]